MSERQRYLRYRTISATVMLETVGKSLDRIKKADKASDADLAATLGKESKDSAERYRKGIGDMGLVSFLRGCAAWDGRFANDVLAKIGMKLVPLDAAEVSDRTAASALTKLLLEMSIALEDGKIDERELASMKGEIEAAGRCIDGMRHRLSVRAA